MEIQGKIKVINLEQQVSASFKKRELVITTEEQYPQSILIEFAQAKCDLLDGYKPNDAVIVHINLRGREWINPQGEAKYFNQIMGWRIEKQPGAEERKPVSTTAHQFEPAANYTEEEHNDLPFN